MPLGFVLLGLVPSGFALPELVPLRFVLPRLVQQCNINVPPGFVSLGHVQVQNRHTRAVGF
jgi:hypothetical protein